MREGRGKGRVLGLGWDTNVTDSLRSLRQQTPGTTTEITPNPSEGSVKIFAG